MSTRAARRSVSVLLLTLLTLALPVVVLGHAELDASDPAEGSTVGAPFIGPVVMTFTEDLGSASKAELIDGAGKVASTTDVDGRTMSLTPDTALEEGDYEVRWLAAADDGHIERGTVQFTVVAAATAVPTATPTATPTPRPEVSATPSASASASPAIQPSAAPASPTPQPSGSADAGNTSSGGDVLLPIIVGALLVGALAFILLRRRDSAPPS